MQGTSVETLALDAGGVIDDRRWALIDGNGKLCSAKRYSKVLFASGQSDGTVILPDGTMTRDNAVLSEWLGIPVSLVERSADTMASLEMTFDPPNDDSEYYEIPAPAGTFLDLAALHVLSLQTLAGCSAVYPEFAWDVRRYRPNIVLDVDVQPFGEDAWSGANITIGEAIIRVDQPTVRCAMPLRAQPDGIERQPGLYSALDELHNNHLGIYCSVVTPGTVNVGDSISVM